MRPLVSIIVINWNGEAVIADCLSSLFKQNYIGIEIIVLDNNSQDNSKKIIKTKFREVKLIELSENIGFANGCNAAIRYANGKYVLFFNNDAQATKSLIARMVKVMEQNKSIVVVQPKIIYRGNPGYDEGTINSVGAYLTPTGFLYYPGYGKPDRLQYDWQVPIFSALGACMLVKKEIIDKIGLFDPDFFMYFEESDFCLRVWLHGKQVVYTPDATIYHKGGVSARKLESEKIAYHSFKNRICSYIKNFEVHNLLAIIFMHIFICESIALVYLISGRISSFIAIQKAIFWNIIHLKSTFKKRLYTQRSLRKADDVDYFPFIMKKPKLTYYLYLFWGLQYYKD